MEFNISDLLDDLREVNIDIRPHTAAPESRIKELTMKRIHTSGKYQKRRRGMGFLGKVLIAAAIITTLAVPVLAASGTQITDWLEGLITPKAFEEDYDNSLLVGGASKKWEVSGWVLEISAEDSSKTGLTFVCKELGNPDKSGTLTTSEGYWLEKWNGTEYAAMEGIAPDGAVLTITDSATERWRVDWTNVYGELPSGSYRIGKAFTYTAGDGNQEQLRYYAKFRIFTDEIEPLIAQYDQAFDALYNRESYHISCTYFYEKKDDYAHHYVSEIWKAEGDYLQITSYYNEDGSLKSHRGYLLRDGMGYELFWVDGNVNGQVSDWKSTDWVEPGTFALWYTFMDLMPSILGEAWDDGNTLYFIHYSDWINENDLEPEDIAELNENSPYWNHDYHELAGTFDENGELEFIRYARHSSLDPAQSDMFVGRTLEVHDTAPDEIAAVIGSQNVSDPPVFSWSAEQAQYAEIGITANLVNTETMPLLDIQSVIDRARKEADPKENPRYRDGYDYNMATVSYDPDASMWKVRLFHSQDDTFLLIVYLNAEGTTQMVVYPYATRDDADATGENQNTFLSFDYFAEINAYKENGNIILDGFVNTEPQNTNTYQRLIDAARKEANPTADPDYQEGYEYDQVTAYYDQDAKVWKILFWTQQDDQFGVIVYTDIYGITQALVYP